MDLFENLTWIHIYHCQRIRASQKVNIRISLAEHERLLLHAQELLSPLSDSKWCRSMKNKWRNRDYCPPSPYGDYWWMFHCEMVQEILWMHPEFIAGYRFGRKPKKPWRDGNPYAEMGRSQSWDCGYILGLTNPKKIMEYLNYPNDAKAPASAIVGSGQSLEQSDILSNSGLSIDGLTE